MSLEIVQRQLEWTAFGGEKKTETVHFRELTGADTLKLVEGQKYRGNPKKGDVEVDITSNVRAQQMLVQLTLVNEDGERIYPTPESMKKISARKLVALQKLAAEVHKDPSTEKPAEDDEAALEVKETPEGKD